MARPAKNNLDYFSHDKDMRNDIKIKALRRKFSHKGYSIYVMMLEHLSNCEYLQFEWSELNIELLTPDFDVDSTELVEVVDYCIKLNLFQIEEGILFSQKFYDRNQDVLGTRKGFSLLNSPLSILKRNKLTDNVVNQELTIVNSKLIHKGKESILKNNIEEDNIEEDNIEKESTTNQSNKNNLLPWEVNEMKGSIYKLNLPTNVQDALVQYIDGAITSAQKELIFQHSQTITEIPALKELLQPINY